MVARFIFNEVRQRSRYPDVLGRKYFGWYMQACLLGGLVSIVVLVLILLPIPFLPGLLGLFGYRMIANTRSSCIKDIEAFERELNRVVENRMSYDGKADDNSDTTPTKNKGSYYTNHPEEEKTQAAGNSGRRGSKMEPWKTRSYTSSLSAELFPPHQFFRTSDGVFIHYLTLGTGPKVIALANGLGCSHLLWERQLSAAYKKLGPSLLEKFTVVTWDYRGLFRSSDPPTGRISVMDLARDLMELLKHLQLDQQGLSAIVGYSCGVQVALQFAARYPEKVGRLLLINGTHGHLLHSVGQPIFRLPFFSLIMHTLIRFLRDDLTNHRVFDDVAAFVVRHLNTIRRLVLKPYGALLGGPHHEWLNMLYLRDVLAADDVHTNEGRADRPQGEDAGQCSQGGMTQAPKKKHLHNMLRLAQELDANSTVHLLPDMRQPTLILAGMLDPVTPAYQSYEMNYLLPNSKLVTFTFGSHWLGFEYQDEVSDLILNFIAKDEVQATKMKQKVN